MTGNTNFEPQLSKMSLQKKNHLIFTGRHIYIRKTFPHYYYIGKICFLFVM